MVVGEQRADAAGENVKTKGFLKKFGVADACLQSFEGVARHEKDLEIGNEEQGFADEPGAADIGEHDVAKEEIGAQALFEQLHGSASGFGGFDLVALHSEVLADGFAEEFLVIDDKEEAMLMIGTQPQGHAAGRKFETRLFALGGGKAKNRQHFKPAEGFAGREKQVISGAHAAILGHFGPGQRALIKTSAGAAIS